jgi:hypothetical protein
MLNINGLKTPQQVKYTILDALLDMQTMVDNGDVNPLEMKILLDDFKKKIDELDEQFKESVFNEAEKYHKQNYGDYYVEVKSGSGRYYYDHIPEIQKLSEQIKELQKFAQDSYKQQTKSLVMLTQDGELISPAVYVPSKSYVVLKRKGG